MIVSSGGQQRLIYKLCGCPGISEASLPENYCHFAVIPMKWLIYEKKKCNNNVHLKKTTKDYTLTLFKRYFLTTIRVLNSLDPDQDRHCVSPDLGPNCLQKLPADDKSSCLQGKKFTLSLIGRKMKNN